MKLDRPFYLEDIKNIFPNIQIESVDNHPIESISLIQYAAEGDLIFVDKDSYLDIALSSEARFITLTPELFSKASESTRQRRIFIVYDDPFAVFHHIVITCLRMPGDQRLVRCSDYEKFEHALVDRSAWISDSAIIGKGTEVWPSVFIGPEVVMGEHCRVMPGARILPGVRIGNEVIIHSNAVIGDDAFYYHKLRKLPSCGGVIIGDNVEIGASCCIDRGILEDTILGSNVKIDNLVQIGHSAVIGDNTIIAGQSGLSGQVKIGSDASIGGQVGIAQNVMIASNVRLYGRCVVTKNIPRSGNYAGLRARPVETEALTQLALTTLAPYYHQIKSIVVTEKGNVEDIFRETVARVLSINSKLIRTDSKLQRDLGADSLDLTQLIRDAENEFGITIPDEKAERMVTFGDALKVIYELRAESISPSQ